MTKIHQKIIYLTKIIKQDLSEKTKLFCAFAIVFLFFLCTLAAGFGMTHIAGNANQPAQEQSLYTAEAELSGEAREESLSAEAAREALRFLVLGEVLILEYLVMLIVLPRWKPGWKTYFFLHPLLLVLGAAVLFFSVEMINVNLGSLGPQLTFENILIYFSLLLAAYVVTTRVSWAFAAVSVVCVVFAIANYYVTLFRSIPIMPGDLYTLRTAANVAGNYRYVLTRCIDYGLIASVFFLGLSVRLDGFGTRWKGRWRALLCVPAVALGFVVLKSDMYCKNMDLWNVKTNITKYGVGVNFVSNIQNMRVVTPVNYSDKKAEALLEQYRQEENGFRPNVIVIMNEAFSDLSVVMDMLDSEQYMPYFNSLQENVVRGTAVSSVRGGLTANAEFEFLTGNSMYFLQNQVPYQQHIYRDTYSIVGVLKERGYTSVGIHPFNASGYNRPSVYSHFGFDSFLSIRDFSDYELVRDKYISDRDSYQKVIQVFEEIQQTGTPAFIFNVTMQNHSTYESGYFGDDVIRVPGMEGKFPDVEEYLTLIRESDQALPVLLDYFSQVEEPTVLLLFGDHQPAINMGFYEAALGKAQNDFLLEDAQITYQVPFLIWANYDIEEEQGIYTSTNYLSAILFEKAGMTPPAYQNYLLELWQTIPAINRYGYLDRNGGWHAVNGQSELQEKLNEYWTLEYYHIF